MTTRRRTARPDATPTAQDQLTIIKNKFAQLTALKAQIASVKDLYRQHDALMVELLPLFITKTDTQFVIQREIVLGNERHRLVPHFYDERKGTLVAKQWKNTAIETASME